MSNQLTQEMFTQLGDAANEFAQIVFEHLQNERGVHVETAICAPCFLAGTLILRSTGVDLSQLEPGQPVLVNIANETSDDVVNDTGKEVLNFMQMVCQAMNLDPFSGWDQTIPDDHQPLLPGIELVRKIEGPFLDLMARSPVPSEYHPHVAAFTGMIIIQMGGQVLNPDLGKAIALDSLVAGCKTVPYRRNNEN